MFFLHYITTLCDGIVEAACLEMSRIADILVFIATHLTGKI